MTLLTNVHPGRPSALAPSQRRVLIRRKGRIRGPLIQEICRAEKARRASELRGKLTAREPGNGKRETGNESSSQLSAVGCQLSALSPEAGNGKRETGNGKRRKTTSYLDGSRFAADRSRRHCLSGRRPDLVVTVERRDLVALREGRVVEDVVDEVVDRAAEGENGLADVHELRGGRADDVHGEKLARLPG